MNQRQKYLSLLGDAKRLSNSNWIIVRQVQNCMMQPALSISSSAFKMRGKQLILLDRYSDVLTQASKDAILLTEVAYRKLARKERYTTGAHISKRHFVELIDEKSCH